jgi:predicted Ser/Thr protein kinase
VDRRNQEEEEKRQDIVERVVKERGFKCKCCKK